MLGLFKRKPVVIELPAGAELPVRDALAEGLLKLAQTVKRARTIMDGVLKDVSEEQINQSSETLLATNAFFAGIAETVATLSKIQSEDIDVVVQGTLQFRMGQSAAEAFTDDFPKLMESQKTRFYVNTGRAAALAAEDDHAMPAKFLKRLLLKVNASAAEVPNDG